jgi:phosphate/sulfate permease
MATFFLILVIILFLLAISDLVVGVSNDAVNFLNAAVGSKAASFKAIMFVAALGVLVGATFSSGMMEVARKGIFHPEYFFFSEIMILFLAVMVTDVILLDTFNSFGMPTSTTVSIVFELLGAAVAISVIKIYTDPNALELYEYINLEKASAIISGILLSVAIAFSSGALVMYLSRLIFSFDYEKRMKRFGFLWGGLGIMAITYFILIKGAKGASWLSDDIVDMLKENTEMLLLYSFLGWSLILFLLNRLFKVDILQVLVLIGTFALAMAFSGNDLVNFIGVPLAGYNSYEIFMDAGGTGADTFLMDGLAGKVPTPTLLLLLAGVIMVVTLYTSKKAKNVIQTSLDLGRQDEGSERFSSFLLSRSLVRNTTSIAKFVSRYMPNSIQKSVSNQFDQTPFTRRQVSKGKQAPVFDKVRASVTLVVASILIAIGTNLKLPLSTTYVTFMVFMGASLADGAWGRDSAVYRVSGVLSVIGGWFFTAFSAFIVACILALIFYFGGMIAIVIILAIAGVVIFHTHRNHNKQVEEQIALDKAMEDGVMTKAEAIDLCSRQLKTFLKQYADLTNRSLDALGQEDLSELSKVYRSFKPIQERITRLKLNSSNALDRVPEHELESGHLYILVVDYLEEMSKEVKNILKNNLDHVDNNHKPLLPEQITELKEAHEMIEERYVLIYNIFKNLDVERASEILESFPEFTRKTRDARKNQIRRIKNHAVGTRNSVLYLNHLSEFRNLAIFGNRIVRVFDELILNPTDDVDFDPSDIRKDLKDMKKEVKSISAIIDQAIVDKVGDNRQTETSEKPDDGIIKPDREA